MTGSTRDTRQGSAAREETDCLPSAQSISIASSTQSPSSPGETVKLEKRNLTKILLYKRTHDDFTHFLNQLSNLPPHSSTIDNAFRICGERYQVGFDDAIDKLNKLPHHDLSECGHTSSDAAAKLVNRCIGVAQAFSHTASLYIAMAAALDTLLGSKAGSVNAESVNPARMARRTNSMQSIR